MVAIDPTVRDARKRARRRASFGRAQARDAGVPVRGRVEMAPSRSVVWPAATSISIRIPEGPPCSDSRSKASGHAFVSVFRIVEPTGWRWGRAVVGGRTSSIDDIGAASDGGLWLGLAIGDENASAVLTDGG